MEDDVYLQTMLCAASSCDSLTSLAPGWQFRPWHTEPVRFTKGSVLSHQPSAGLLREIPRSAQVSSSEVTMEGLDQLPVLSTCTMVQALCLATYELLSAFLISALHSSTQSCKIHNVYDGFRQSRATVTPVRPHSVSRIDSELLTMEKCSFRSNKIVRNVTCDVPQTFPTQTVL